MIEKQNVISRRRDGKTIVNICSRDTHSESNFVINDLNYRRIWSSFLMEMRYGKQLYARPFFSDRAVLLRVRYNQL